MLKGLEVAILILDDLDCHIIVSFWEAALEGKELTTWKISESFFNCEKEENKNRFLTAQSTKVSWRIKKMVKDGFIEIHKENGRNKFILNDSKMILKKTRFPDGRLLHSVCVKDNKERWMIFQI